MNYEKIKNIKYLPHVTSNMLHSTYLCWNAKKNLLTSNLITGIYIDMHLIYVDMRY